MTATLSSLLPALWALAVTLPLAWAGMLGVLTHGGRRSPQDRLSLLLRLAPLSLLPAALLTLVPTLDSAAPQAVEFPHLLFGTVLQVDPIGRTLLLVAVLLYGAALASLQFRFTERAGHLAAFLLVCFTGTMLVYTAGDLVVFYLGYAFMSFAAYGLVVHLRTAAAFRAGRIYLVLTVASEFAVLAALIMIGNAGGTLISDAPQAVLDSPYSAMIVVLLIVGFGVKAGLFPLHIWLPLAHPAAPPAASAVLSGAMVKAGLMGWLRFLPLGEISLPGVGTTVVVLALLGALLSVPLGAMQRDPKVVLAYSTISQMAYLSAVVGATLMVPALAPASLSAASIYAVHHGLAKGALFLGVPIWKHHAHGRERIIAVGGLLIAAAAVVGAPFSGGSVGKYATKYAVEGVSVLGVQIYDLLPWVAVGSTILLMRTGLLLWRTEVQPVKASTDPEFWAWLMLVLTSATVPFLLTNAWLPVAGVPDLDPVTLWDATWPLLVGLAIGAGGALLASRMRTSPWLDAAGEPVIPPGDVVVLAERGASVSVRAGSLLARHTGRMRDSIVSGARTAGQAVLQHAHGTSRAEGGLSSWRGSGVAILVAILALTGWVVWG